MEEKLADDLMIGAKPIADWLGSTARQVFYWAETKQMPIFKIGNRLAARKSTLAQHVSKLESAKVA
jgi:hypothetical protein